MNRFFYIKKHFDCCEEKYIWRFWIFGFYFDTCGKWVIPFIGFGQLMFCGLVSVILPCRHLKP